MSWCNNELIIIALFLEKGFLLQKETWSRFERISVNFWRLQCSTLTINQNIKSRNWIFETAVCSCLFAYAVNEALDTCIFQKKKCLSCSYFNAPWWHYNIQVHCIFIKNKLLNFGFKVP